MVERFCKFKECLVSHNRSSDHGLTRVLRSSPRVTPPGLTRCTKTGMSHGKFTRPTLLLQSKRLSISHESPHFQNKSELIVQSIVVLRVSVNISLLPTSF